MSENQKIVDIFLFLRMYLKRITKSEHKKLFPHEILCGKPCGIGFCVGSSLEEPTQNPIPPVFMRCFAPTPLTGGSGESSPLSGRGGCYISLTQTEPNILVLIIFKKSSTLRCKKSFFKTHFRPFYMIRLFFQQKLHSSEVRRREIYYSVI